VIYELSSPKIKMRKISKININARDFWNLNKKSLSCIIEADVNDYMHLVYSFVKYLNCEQLKTTYFFVMCDLNGSFKIKTFNFKGYLPWVGNSSILVSIM